MPKTLGEIRIGDFLGLNTGMSFVAAIAAYEGKKLAETSIADDEIPALVDKLKARVAHIRSTETQQRGSRLVPALECAIVDLRARLVAHGETQGDEPPAGTNLFVDRRPSER